MTESEILYFWELILCKNDKSMNDEEFNSLYDVSPDKSKEAFDIFTANRLTQTTEVIL